MRSKVILATRSSSLALAQANLVKEELKKHWAGLEVEILSLKTSGDLILDRPLRAAGGKGLFVKEIEEALLREKADIAVHSMKDVPAELPQRLEIGVILSREDPADVLISRNQERLHQLPPKTIVGTTSLRRKIQLLQIRPNLKVADLRGNVDTRLRKLKEGQYGAIILAAAALKRLGRYGEATETLPFIAAPGQGAIGIESREGDHEIKKLIQFLHHAPTASCVDAERVVLRRLEGGCELPLGAQATLVSNKLHLKAFVANPSGNKFLQDEVAGDAELAKDLGEKLCDLLLTKGAGEILEEIKKLPYS